jgi:hypothetical protein
MSTNAMVPQETLFFSVSLTIVLSSFNTEGKSCNRTYNKQQYQCYNLQHSYVSESTLEFDSALLNAMR